jgi:hypothetical protein
MAKIRYVMVGSYPNCGEEYVRKSPANAAVCTCRNPDATLVPLKPALVLPTSIYKRYAKIAELTEVSVERLINAELEEAARQKLASLRSEELEICAK